MYSFCTHSSEYIYTCRICVKVTAYVYSCLSTLKCVCLCVTDKRTQSPLSFKPISVSFYLRTHCFSLLKSHDKISYGCSWTCQTKHNMTKRWPLASHSHTKTLIHPLFGVTGKLATIFFFSVWKIVVIILKYFMITNVHTSSFLI